MSVYKQTWLRIIYIIINIICSHCDVMQRGQSLVPCLNGGTLLSYFYSTSVNIFDCKIQQKNKPTIFSYNTLFFIGKTKLFVSEINHFGLKLIFLTSRIFLYKFLFEQITTNQSIHGKVGILWYRIISALEYWLVFLGFCMHCSGWELGVDIHNTEGGVNRYRAANFMPWG